jgi:diguanylate cyclase (GGDEF)-like protein/PAS domain S-box-containing protein
MKFKHTNTVKKSLSKQLLLMFASGMLSLALIVSISTAWVTGEQIRSQLINESLQITSALANQSYLALIYESGENALDAVTTTLSFPNVTGVAILDKNKKPLLTKGEYDPRAYEFPALDTLGESATLLNETDNTMSFVAAVYQPENSNPYAMFANDDTGRELLGLVHVVVDKGAQKTNRDTVFINNTAIAIVVTIGLLLLLSILLKRITNPLATLSRTMQRAQAGDTSVNAAVIGPVEIARIADVFNDMMAALNERQEELFREKERALFTLESIADGVITTNTGGQVIYLNPVAERLTGVTLEQAKSLELNDIFRVFNTATRVEDQNPIEECLSSGVVMGPLQHRFYRPRIGDEIHIKHSVAPIKNREGAVAGAVMVFHDETEARKLEQKLTYQATHDALTGLTNRTEFESHLVEVMRNMDEKTEHALCYLDLDQFKVINDTCGHLAGDQLLQNITNLLLQRIRKNEDTLARLGGDEFVLLIEHCTLEQASIVASQLCQAVRDYRYVFEGNPFTIGISIGVVPLTINSRNYQEIISKADTACFMAKEKGRNRVHVYRADDEEMVQRHGEMQVLTSITEAFDDDSFYLFYQPIVDIRNDSGICDHYEILLRMKDRDGNWISPGYFLPAAERYNVAHKIDRHVIRKTLNWLCDHPKQLEQLKSCSINLSGMSLNDDELFDFILEQFNITKVPPAKICFEITETAAISHLSGATGLIRELRELGCKTALDDFGSGMSSFAYLKNFEIDYLKIDGLFVRDILSDPIDDAMVKSINDIGHILGLITIAEYVENESILKRLNELGVDQVQGYFIAKPEPIENMLTERGA